ncbi:MAG: hypothetical protein RLZZ350_2227 [Verrucomicrobiota bacterium]|jgi:uncharacterized protein YggT (Ycf19 family)
MAIINSILNFAGLLLWLGWRDLVLGSLLNHTGTPLVRTIRRAGNSRLERQKYLLLLAGLLLLRAVGYWWLGSAVNWTPRLDLLAVVLPFRPDFFWQTCVFSALSFAATLAVFYLSLLLLSLLHRDSEIGLVQKFVRLHLGRFGRWPGFMRVLLPVVVAVAIWLLLHPILRGLEIVPRGVAFAGLLKQGVLIGCAALLAGKYILAALLTLHFVGSYLYLGANPLWEYVEFTGQRLLAPLRRLPLKIGRVDFAPVLALVILFLAASFAQNGLHVHNRVCNFDISGLADIYRWNS